ncbi:MAG TPA: isoprenyl transferase [Hyphomicrobiales bacterium]|nr:isoprenyl transferase [Rhodobiaceae bacterium]HXK54346.1 isoprenyl transferase [Hyphomicrobiales bacterium]
MTAGHKIAGRAGPVAGPQAGAGGGTVPRHVAIIMDGNGRWALRRGMSRTRGHRHGMEAVRRIVREAGDLGIEYLSLYAFSSENWSRPAGEVRELMGLLKLFIRRDLAELHEANVRVRVIGRRDDLKPDIRRLIEESEALTAANSGLNLIVAFNYGAQDEITRAVQDLAGQVKEGTIDPAEITAAMISQRLDTAGVPNPDLLIRTSGERRLSNFLLWQCAYTEFVFVDELWPDFTGATLRAALEEYGGRERRFGGLAAKAAP